MKKYLLTSLVALTSLAFADFTPAPMNDSFMSSSQQMEPKMMIHNRPLAKINSRVISLMDIVKKMNVFINDYHPEVRENEVALYQFYSTNWQSVLDEIINNELMLLDATDQEIPVSDGDIHEEMEERFGPNVMGTLDRVSMDYEEAYAMIQSEILVRQMLYLKVHMRAKHNITPKLIKEFYETYLKTNPATEQWQYQVLTIHGQDEEQCSLLATKISGLIENNGLSLKEIQEKLELEEDTALEGIRVSLSEDFDVNENSVSKQHQAVLTKLDTGMHSSPEKQTSRHDNSTVYRIFHLKSHVRMEPQSFQEIAQNLEDELYHNAFQSNQTEYIEKLKKKYDIEKNPYFDTFSADYQPFTIH